MERSLYTPLIQHSDTQQVPKPTAPGVPTPLHKGRGARSLSWWLHEVCAPSSACLPLGDKVTQATFTEDGRLVATASDDHTARVFVVETGEEKQKFEHHGGVACVAFNRDGQMVATASDDHTARIFVVETGEEKHKFGHDDEVVHVVFSGDGQMVATASKDSTARVYLVETGEEKQKFKHDAAVFHVAFSRDGLMVASASRDTTARVFVVETGEVKQKFEHDVDVFHVVFSGDGQMVATASRDHTARVFVVETGEEKHKFNHNDEVKHVAFSQDGQMVATASYDHTARVFDVETGEEKRKFKHDGHVSHVAFSGDGQMVATASFDSTACVFAIETGKTMHKFKHCGSVRHIAFVGDGQMASTASSSTSAGAYGYKHAKARVFMVKRGEEKQKFRHDAKAHHVAFSRDGQLVATASSDHTARVFVAETGEEKQKFKHDGQVVCVAFSGDGQMVATASSDHTARVFVVETGEEKQKFAHDGPVACVAFSGDGQMVATASYDNTARVFVVETGEEKHRFTHDEQVFHVVFSGDGQMIATGSQDETARVFMVDSGEQKQKLKHEAQVFRVVFSVDGEMVATASVDRIARVFMVETGDVKHKFRHGADIFALAFSEDGQMVATASDDNTARVFVVKTGEEKQRFKHDGVVKHVAFSEDGQMVATASSDHTACVFAVETGEEKYKFNHDAEVKHVAFSKDGAMVATVSDDTSVRVFMLGESDRSWSGLNPLEIPLVDLCGWSELRVVCRSCSFPVPCFVMWRLLLVEKDRWRTEDNNDTVSLWTPAVKRAYDRRIRRLGPRGLFLVDDMGASAISLASELTDRSIIADLLSCPGLLHWVQNHPEEIFHSAFARHMTKAIVTLIDSAAHAGCPFTLAQLIQACCFRLSDLLDHRLVSSSKPPARGTSEMLAFLSVGPGLPICFPHTDPERKQRHRPDAFEVSTYVVLLEDLLTELAPSGDDLLSLLCRTPMEVQDEVDLFTCDVVRAMVHFKWQYWYRYAMAEFVLYIVFLASYVAMTTAKDAEFREGAWMVAAASALLLCMAELMEISTGALRRIRAGRAPKLSFWSLPPLLLAPGSVVIWWFTEHYADAMSETAALLKASQSLVAFILWGYALHFLSSFAWAGGYVRMLEDVFIDIAGFLAVLLIILLGTAHGFAIANSSRFSRELQVTYRMGILGDFDAEVIEEDAVHYILFMLCTVIISVMLLNMLIAVISDTYARINEHKDAASVKARAGVICELEASYGKMKVSMDSHFLLFIKRSPPVEEQIFATKEDLEKLHDSLGSTQEQIVSGTKDELVDLRDSLTSTEEQIASATKDELQDLRELIVANKEDLETTKEQIVSTTKDELQDLRGSLASTEQIVLATRNELHDLRDSLASIKESLAKLVEKQEVA